MSWEQALSAGEKLGQSKYCRIESGDSSVIVFLDSPKYELVSWSDEESRYVKYDASKHAKKTIKYRCNVLDLSTHGPKAEPQVFEFGKMLASSPADSIKKFPVGEYAFEIKREGQGLKTKWTAIVDKPIEKFDGLKARIESGELELHDTTWVWETEEAVEEVPF